MDSDRLKVLCRYAQKSAGIRGEMRGKSCLLENIISCAIMSQNKSIFIGSFTFFPKFWALSITEIEKEGKERKGKIAVCTAGTADIPVAEEAAQTAEYFGTNVERIYDIGVAGIHRLLSRLEVIQSANCVIAVAGT